MQLPVSIDTFYAETLKAAGITPPADDIEKVAAEKHFDVETAKIARAIFEQTQLDGIEYASDTARLEDAMKIARAWQEHNTKTAAAAHELASSLAEVVEKALEDHIKTAGLDLTVEEALKAAAWQYQDLIEKTASPFIPGMEIGPSTYNPVVHGAEIDQAMSAPQGSGARFITQEAMKHEMKPHEYGALLAKSQRDNPHFGGFNDHVNHVRGMIANAKAPATQPGFFANNKGKLLAGGALGLGALWLLRKKQQESEAQRNREMAIMRSAALPSA